MRKWISICHMQNSGHFVPGCNALNEVLSLLPIGYGRVLSQIGRTGETWQLLMDFLWVCYCPSQLVTAAWKWTRNITHTLSYITTEASKLPWSRCFSLSLGHKSQRHSGNFIKVNSVKEQPTNYICYAQYSCYLGSHWFSCHSAP